MNEYAIAVNSCLAALGVPFHFLPPRASFLLALSDPPPTLLHQQAFLPTIIPSIFIEEDCNFIKDEVPRSIYEEMLRQHSGQA